VKKSSLAAVRRLLVPLKNTLIHPQFLSYRDNVLKTWLSEIAEHSAVLDIGCNDRWPEPYLSSDCDYFGLDYYSIELDRYDSQVDLFGDAQCLPFTEECIDAVLLFDVLEHIPDATAVFRELNRVLKKGGVILVQIPFIYPIHDAPFDFRRPTIHGLKSMAANAGLVIDETASRGRSIETACLLMNIAIASRNLSLFKSRKFIRGGVMLPFTLGLCLSLNLLGWMDSVFASRHEDLMPFSYQLRLQKP